MAGAMLAPGALKAVHFEVARIVSSNHMDRRVVKWCGFSLKDEGLLPCGDTAVNQEDLAG